MPSVRIAFAAALSLLAPASCLCRRDPPREPVESPMAFDDLASASVIRSEQILAANDELETCPEVEGWSASPLWEDDDPPALRRFCRYTTEADGQELDDRVERLRKDLERKGPVDPDRSVVVPLGALEDTFAPWDQAVFREQVGAIAPPTSPTAPEVALVVVDSARDAAGAAAFARPEGTGTHGFVLLNAAGSMLCPSQGAPCPVDIRSRQALPFTGSGDARSGGVVPAAGPGHIGTWTTLADALMAEARSLRRKPGRVVVNLSLGWDPRFGGGPGMKPSSWKAPVVRVYRALRALQCEGALVVAATGNFSPGGATGPMLPAGWSGTSVVETCADITGSHSGATRDAAPLLYAVGGVDAVGTDLSIARPGARPHLLAYGDHVTVEATDGAPTPPLTGSSAAALVTSAVAAAVWTNAPGLEAHEVMSRLFASGDVAGPRDEAFLSWSFPQPEGEDDTGIAWGLQARRVDPCATIGAGGSASTEAYTCAAAPAASSPDSTALAAFDAAATPLAPTFDATTACSAEGEYYVPSGTTPANPCPQATWPDLVTNGPWVLTQGPETGCPYCVVTATAPVVLRLENATFLKTAAANGSLELVYTATDGSQKTRGYLVSPIPAGSSVSVTISGSTPSISVSSPTSPTAPTTYSLSGARLTVTSSGLATTYPLTVLR